MSVDTLLREIEGFVGAHSGSPDHETSVELLKRVQKDIARGKNTTAIDSPGKRESMAAAQRHMPAEAGHNAGEGNRYSVAPSGDAAERGPAPDETPNPHQGNEKDVLRNAGPAPSMGERYSAKPAPMPAYVSEIRRIAADKEMSRPDSKFRPQEGPNKMEGNRFSAKASPEPPASERLGKVEIAKIPSDRGIQGGSVEGTPNFAKEGIGAVEREARLRLRKGQSQGRSGQEPGAVPR